jgi:hypothetical protein
MYQKSAQDRRIGSLILRSVVVQKRHHKKVVSAVLEYAALGVPKTVVFETATMNRERANQAWQWMLS